MPGAIVDPEELEDAVDLPRLGAVVDSSDVEEATSAPGEGTGFGTGFGAGLRESAARTGEEIAQVSDWLGWDSGAESLRGWSREQREGMPEIGGLGGTAGYIAGNAPLEIVKFASLAAALGPLGGTAMAARVPAIIAKALPWAVAGGALETLRPGATPQSVIGEAAIGGAIPALSRFSRPVRGAAMGAVGAGAGMAEGQDLPEALTQGAALSVLSMIPGKAGVAGPRGQREWEALELAERAQKAAQVEAARGSPMFADLEANLGRVGRRLERPTVGDTVKTQHGSGKIQHVFDDETATVGYFDRQAATATRTPLSEMTVTSRKGRRGLVPDTVRENGPVPPEQLAAAKGLWPEIETSLALEREIPARIGASAVETRIGRSHELVKMIRGPKDVQRVTATMVEELGDMRGVRGEITPVNLSIARAMKEEIRLSEILGRKAHDPIGETQSVHLMALQNAAHDNYAMSLTEFTKKGFTDGRFADMIEDLARLKMFTEPLQSGKTSAGRTLNLFKYQKRARSVIAARIVKQMGGEENAKATAALLKTMGLDEVLANADTILAPTWGQKVLELWKMGLLSGPVTHVVNNTSNLGFQALDLAENALAAGVGKLRPGSKDKVYFREISARLGAIRAFPEALAAAKKSFMLEQEGFALGKVELGHRGAIGGKFGKLVRFPGKLLVAEDEFWKVFANRMELSALAARKAAGKGLRGQERADFIRATLAKPDDAMLKAAGDSARRLTFTTEVGPSFKHLQRFIQSNVVGGFIMPFFRTPVNIAGQAIIRMPGGSAFSAAERAAWKAGGAARDQLIARQLMGAGLVATAAAMVKAGTLTGGGPSEPGRKNAMYPTWQPYSKEIPEPVRALLGDRWISFNRLEPIGMVLGMATDMAEYGADWDDMEWSDRMGRLVKVFSKNLASKTFIKGLADVMLAAMNPEMGAENWAESMSRSFVPASALMGQTARALDPTRREINNPLEAVQGQIPGLRSKLQASSTVTGEPSVYGNALGPDALSPFYGTDISQDPVAQELGRLASDPKIDKAAGDKPLSLGKPQRKLHGDPVELTNEEYDQLWGQANRTAAAKVARRIERSSWNSERMTDARKIDIIEGIYRDARGDAREKIKRARRRAARRH